VKSVYARTRGAGERRGLFRLDVEAEKTAAPVFRSETRAAFVYLFFIGRRRLSWIISS
jgi:hypothetical protein